jgi:hypothetical protein
METDDAKMLADAKWAEAVRNGSITPAKVALRELPPRLPIMSFETLMRELSADREDR